MAGISSAFSKFSDRLRLLIPERVRRSWQRRRKVGRPRDYYYIKYAISVLRVIAWVVVVLGFIGSLIWGINTGGLEGGGRIIAGMVGSFLAWLLLIAARELLKLFLDVRENTGNSARRVTTGRKLH